MSDLVETPIIEQKENLLSSLPKEELITTLGEEYWEAAWRLMEDCHEKQVKIPTIEIPLFSAIALAEKGGAGKMREFYRMAKSGVLSEVKALLDIFLALEKYKNSQEPKKV
jgi:hypothetical protein